MKKLSMLVALLCILIIPEVHSQVKDLPGDTLKGEWIDESSNCVIKVIEFGGKYYAEVVGYMLSDSSVIYAQDDNYPNSKYIGIVVFEQCEYENSIWTGKSRYYDYTTGIRYRYEIEIKEANKPKRVTVSLRRTFGSNKTTHWTKRDNN